MAIDLSRFHDSFFTESLQGLDATETELLALENDGPTSERLNAIFRGVHSIKGGSGSLGFSAIADFTHHVEGALDRLRMGTLSADSETLDCLLDCVDYSRSLVLAARDGKPVDADRAQDLLGELDSLTNTESTAQASAQQPVKLPVAKYHIHFEPSADFFRSGNDPLRLLQLLDELGEMNAKVDVSRLLAESFDAESCYLAWNIELSTSASRSEIDEIFSWVQGDCKLTIEALAPPETPQVAEERARVDSERLAEDRRRRLDRRVAARRSGEGDLLGELRAESLQVSRDKVDDLINLVGELVITRTMLKQSVGSLGEESAARLEATLAQLERNTRDLQESVMAIRMLPVSHAFGRFGRLVRDVSQHLGKLVQLEISGEHSELDKMVIEKLVDPLTHLVRNALDHGIEPPEARRSAGKPETATLKLHAEHRGGHIEILVSDDGRGIDLARVEEKAREMGLLGEAEVINPERLRECIFEPGFSTAAEVNDLSGRGVGLDVVRKNILALSGTIKVESSPGLGTAFLIRLPLTLAIIDGMTVTVGADTYIVPMACIIECLRPDPRALKSVAGRGVLLEVRGEYLPLLKLGDLTGVADAAPFESGLLLVLEADGHPVVLLVDALLGQDQIVIKSLENNYRKIPHIAGATILGEGNVVLILDVGALARGASLKNSKFDAARVTLSSKQGA
ncbi:MAG: chemotaxis protein CheA [Burkholderiales bacterium]|nr:chemotaxis protein CheA [Burkholderiales bacterium]